MIRRVAAAALVPLLLVASVANAAALYRCRMDGTVRRSCCCPPDDSEAVTQTVSQANCCDVQMVPRRQAPASTEARGIAIAPVIFAILHSIDVAPPCVAHRFARTERPRGLGPPLIAVKSSRLI
jgi:hypothetical protein